MDLLLTAATAFEIQPTIDWLEQNGRRIGAHTVNYLITGVGGLATSWELATHFQQNPPDAALQAGIAGSFSTNYPPGTVALVREEYTGDTGVEENNCFRDLFDLGFQQPGQFPYSGRALTNPALSGDTYLGLPVVNGVTVGEISTRPERIAQLQQNYAPVVESMEGAAFHYACLRQGIPFLQLRAVSNSVGERDKSKWQLKPAIELLNNTLINLLDQWLLALPAAPHKQ
ncbi:MAG: futalosine hydrolase [Candidatus Pseudobacter hemicellulosilyticus]|uniref:Futalosine hydrolase n=1 Tax=Candidatus Pseudobacter hemicellulosilyticus TaxID=3121375 RepID=A0AAJ5WUG6_9BACT|nr:MAG: futalosine hydrolase [Pseudobacter sp.]